MSTDENSVLSPDQVISALGYDPEEVTEIEREQFAELTMDDVDEFDDDLAGDFIYTYLQLSNREKELLRDQIELLNEQIEAMILPTVVTDVLEEAGLSEQTTNELLAAMIRLSKNGDE